jgi:hypothetical protein
METNNTTLPQPPFAISSENKSYSFLYDKKTIAIIGVVLIGGLFVAYKMKYLDFLFKKKDKTVIKEELTEEKQNLNIIDLEKDYYINDENNVPLKINLKEMISLHKHYMEQQMIQQQQMMQQQMIQQQMQQQFKQPEIVKKPKLKHVKKVKISSEEEELSSDDLESLKKELKDLENQNKNV